MITVGDAHSEGIVIVAHFGTTAIHFRMSSYVAYELAEKAKAGETVKVETPWEIARGE